MRKNKDDAMNVALRFQITAINPAKYEPTAQPRAPHADSLPILNLKSWASEITAAGNMPTVKPARVLNKRSEK